MFIDGRGRRAEVIILDRDGRGPRPYVRLSWRNRILIGAGYYRHVDEALALMDAETLVEVVTHPACR